jgi:hypothetical protein
MQHVAPVARRDHRGVMKRIAVWAFYGIGMLAILYLALYAYAAFTGHGLEPGDPIHIFRKPDATKQAVGEMLERTKGWTATDPRNPLAAWLRKRRRSASSASGPHQRTSLG